MQLVLPTGSTWELGDGARARAKLDFRAGLPGAFAFDRAAHAFRVARRAGVACRDLLAPACAASWLVNSAIPSTTMRRWLEPPLADVLGELADALASRAFAWASFDDAERRALADALAVLDLGPRSLGALTKILASLAPESVPMMPDAAVRFVLGDAAVQAPAEPSAFDVQTAKLASFAPVMDWFTEAARANAPTLADVARDLPRPPLAPAQVLDRLLWVDSEGFRHLTPGGPSTPTPPRRAR
jgi:hypothetical protein